MGIERRAINQAGRRRACAGVPGNAWAEARSCSGTAAAEPCWAREVQMGARARAAAALDHARTGGHCARCSAGRLVRGRVQAPSCGVRHVSGARHSGWSDPWDPLAAHPKSTVWHTLCYPGNPKYTYREPWAAQGHTYGEDPSHIIYRSVVLPPLLLSHSHWSQITEVKDSHATYMM